jgi:hypothetical protein
MTRENVIGLGFVWPKWLPLTCTPLGSFGQNAGRRLSPPWVRLAKMLSSRPARLGFVWPKRSEPCIRWVHSAKLPGAVCAPRPLGGLHPLQCDLITMCVSILSRDRARQMAHLGDQRGIMENRDGQAVPARIARRSRLALGSLRSPAATAVGATRIALECTSHAGSCAGTIRGRPSVWAFHPLVPLS